jgi:tetratricopeptide (TPR) repeat protein
MHCPYCGSIVKEEESYCISCGKMLPTDMHLRSTSKKSFTKLWGIPFITFVLVLLSISLFHSFLKNQEEDAKHYYDLGEKSLLSEDYKTAKDFFTKAVDQKSNFKQGQMALAFIKKSEAVNNLLNKADQELKEQNFQSSLSHLHDAEELLKNYDGKPATNLINKIDSYRNLVKIEQLKIHLSEDPSVSELKSLLWEADSIKTDEAQRITETIREQLIDYAYTKASEMLSEKQFSDAQYMVEDGLKYAPNSEKLLSLKTTIEKEKVSFEITQEQRIQQAIDTAEEEREMNETDAIKLVAVKLENDKQGNLVVKGEVKSVGTVPISSVLVEYALKIKDKEFLTNNVYVYPDTLYPDENGKFEFTHYDINKDVKKMNIRVKKITWYTNY